MRFPIPLLFLLILQACSQTDKPLFEELTSEQTGIAFVNTVVQDGDNNVLKYPYYFNGGGVAVGDLNNDGLADVYFTGNRVPNQLYLNRTIFQKEGGEAQLHFDDVTEKAGVGAAAGWKTGVTLADVNADGWLDIYVCRSAQSDSTLRRNLLYINNHADATGVPTFTERAAEFGIADDSYSTQAAFFDYDRDGDLDLFVLNHSLPQYAGFSKLLGTLKTEKSAHFGSKLYSNEGSPTAPRFVDVSATSGLINNALSFGLGIAVSDLNADGWPDLYISNDFNEEDYLLLNIPDAKPGEPHFRNVIKTATGHTSLYSMGSDVADINNDARPDIITLDMLPATNERIKLSSGDDNFDKYNQLLRAGFHPQTMRNMVQLSVGRGAKSVEPRGKSKEQTPLLHALSSTPLFSDIGQLSGVSNTDWSWSALLADYDGDGWKDLFVTNGYEKDYTNMQFLKYTVDERVKAQQGMQAASVDQILDKMPGIDVGGYLFRNNGDSSLTFRNITQHWGLTRAVKANGAAYADLDNDGDLDLLANVMNGPSVVYKNRSVEDHEAGFLTVDLAHDNPTRQLIGTKVWVYAGGRVQYEEFSPVRGFQSCSYGPLRFGMTGHATADSVRIVYPDNKTQLLVNVPVKQPLQPRYGQAVAGFVYPAEAPGPFTIAPVPGWVQTPVDTNDFKQQLLLPYQFSYSGPKLATGDVNGDGQADVYACGPKNQAGVLFLQQANGALTKVTVPAFEADKGSQDEAAAFFDADGDGDQDLYVVSGGYPFAAGDPLLQDRLYLNDGKGGFSKAPNALPVDNQAGSCVVPLDVDSDKDLDLFVGTRFVPGQYPRSERSFLLINSGKGPGGGPAFTKAPASALPLPSNGLVCDARAADLNKDGRPDLVVVGEWMAPMVLLNEGGRFADATKQWMPANQEGWWNCLTLADFDNDGDMDMVAGNYGLNSQFKASPARPVQLTYGDFDGDGRVDPFMTYFVQGKAYPYASRDEALGQVNFLKARFPDYTLYANATLSDLFTPDELIKGKELSAKTLQSTYYENRRGKFVAHPLPVEAQFAPVFALEPLDYDHDGDLDLLLGGNIAQARVRVGRSDASYVPLFDNQRGHFRFRANAGIRGDVRGLAQLNDSEVLVGVNGGSLLRVVLM
ncbi:VCBS repeat-containing protein [Fibrella aquatilis]|uniref:VCBS repeat-containing protein n=1 Tax=Fibrella aquatilis TaxID=2817059 RepID=A0A939G1I5_9BACT|nr:VCBS repeat-containing protein [Fibrella aquatilis]MBO0930289.1 VCBS repeat-containing protein [Fibrella aquatilis]